MGVSDQGTPGVVSGTPGLVETEYSGSDLHKFLKDLEQIVVFHENRMVAQSVPETPEALLRGMICAMCDFPESVVIDQHVTDHSASFDIHLHPEDVSKVLGTGGSHATALRVLFSAIYSKRRKKLHLMVVNPNYRR